jgi:hypothetical protein
VSGQAVEGLGLGLDGEATDALIHGMAYVYRYGPVKPVRPARLMSDLIRFAGHEACSDCQAHVQGCHSPL